jgi:hypothetical protein
MISRALFGEQRLAGVIVGPRPLHEFPVVAAGAHLDARLGEVVGEDPLVALVLGPFALGQRDGHALDVVRCEVLAGEFLGGQGVGDRADEVGDDLVCVVRSLEGGSQSQSGGGGEVARDVAVALAAEMVDLVEHDQTEPVADRCGAAVRGSVRRDGDRAGLLHAAAELTDLGIELPFEFRAPLAQQVDGGDDHERSNADAFDRTQRDDRLPAPGREFDDAAAAGLVPRRQRRFLVRPQTVRGGDGEVGGGEDAVLDGEVRVAQRVHQVGVAPRGGAVPAGPLVPVDERAVGDGHREVVAGQSDRAVLEGERDDHGGSGSPTGISAASGRSGFGRYLNAFSRGPAWFGQ